MANPTPEERAAALAGRVLADDSSDLFVYEKWTADAIREAENASRAKAFEEAAKLCDGLAGEWGEKAKAFSGCYKAKKPEPCGQPVRGDLVTDCFVLRPMKDHAARAALKAYADAKGGELAQDLYAWLRMIEEAEAPKLSPEEVETLRRSVERHRAERIARGGGE